MKHKKIKKYIVGVGILVYLVLSYIFGTFNLFSLSMGLRILCIISLVLAYLVLATAIQDDLVAGRNFFKDPTHEEKKKGIKKYVGELKEELDMLEEARQLELKVNNFLKNR